MRPAALLAATLTVLPGVFGESRKSAIVWFEDTVSDEVVQKAKHALEQAGGMITHSYEIIKGFSVLAPEQAFTDIRVQFDNGEQALMHIDNDDEVGTFGKQ